MRAIKTLRRHNTFTVVVAIFIGVVAALMLVLASGGISEDTRETRTFGNLTCVYNVTQDKIEACSDGTLSPGNG